MAISLYDRPAQDNKVIDPYALPYEIIDQGLAAQQSRYDSSLASIAKPYEDILAIPTRPTVGGEEDKMILDNIATQYRNESLDYLHSLDDPSKADPNKLRSIAFRKLDQNKQSLDAIARNTKNYNDRQALRDKLDSEGLLFDNDPYNKDDDLSSVADDGTPQVFTVDRYQRMLDYNKAIDGIFKNMNVDTVVEKLYDPKVHTDGYSTFKEGVLSKLESQGYFYDPLTKKKVTRDKIQEIVDANIDFYIKDTPEGRQQLKGQKFAIRDKILREDPNIDPDVLEARVEVEAKKAVINSMKGVGERYRYSNYLSEALRDPISKIPSSTSRSRSTPKSPKEDDPKYYSSKAFTYQIKSPKIGNIVSISNTIGAIEKSNIRDVTDVNFNDVDNIGSYQNYSQIQALGYSPGFGGEGKSFDQTMGDINKKYMSNIGIGVDDVAMYDGSPNLVYGGQDDGSGYTQYKTVSNFSDHKLNPFKLRLSEEQAKLFREKMAQETDNPMNLLNDKNEFSTVIIDYEKTADGGKIYKFVPHPFLMDSNNQVKEEFRGLYDTYLNMTNEDNINTSSPYAEVAAYHRDRSFQLRRLSNHANGLRTSRSKILKGAGIKDIKAFDDMLKDPVISKQIQKASITRYKDMLDLGFSGRRNLDSIENLEENEQKVAHDYLTDVIEGNHPIHSDRVKTINQMRTYFSKRLGPDKDLTKAIFIMENVLYDRATYQRPNASGTTTTYTPAFNTSRFITDPSTGSMKFHIDNDLKFKLDTNYQKKLSSVHPDLARLHRQTKNLNKPITLKGYGYTIINDSSASSKAVLKAVKRDVASAIANNDSSLRRLNFASDSETSPSEEITKLQEWFNLSDSDMAKQARKSGSFLSYISKQINEGNLHAMYQLDEGRTLVAGINMPLAPKYGLNNPGILQIEIPNTDLGNNDPLFVSDDFLIASGMVGPIMEMKGQLSKGFIESGNLVSSIGHGNKEKRVYLNPTTTADGRAGQLILLDYDNEGNEISRAFNSTNELIKYYVDSYQNNSQAILRLRRLVSLYEQDPEKYKQFLLSQYKGDISNFVVPPIRDIRASLERLLKSELENNKPLSSRINDDGVYNSPSSGIIDKHYSTTRTALHKDLGIPDAELLITKDDKGNNIDYVKVDFTDSDSNMNPDNLKFNMPNYSNLVIHKDLYPAFSSLINSLNLTGYNQNEVTITRALSSLNKQEALNVGSNIYESPHLKGLSFDLDDNISFEHLFDWMLSDEGEKHMKDLYILHHKGHYDISMKKQSNTMNSRISVDPEIVSKWDDEMKKLYEKVQQKYNLKNT